MHGIAPNRIYLGNGTGHRAYLEQLRAKNIDCSVIDEKDTTLEGRKLYWKLHPPTGLWRFIPLSLRVPPRPVDDFAAWAILRKALFVG